MYVHVNAVYMCDSSGCTSLLRNTHTQTHTLAVYNHVGEARVRFCGLHKEPNMVDVKTSRYVLCCQKAKNVSAFGLCVLWCT